MGGELGPDLDARAGRLKHRGGQAGNLALGTRPVAATVADMLEHVANILVTIANGAATVIGAVADLRVVLVAVSAASLAWLAAVEIEQLDRKGYKPGVRAH